MIDFMFKASSKADFEAFALEKGWLRTSEDRQGNPTLVPAPGVDIDHIGPIVVTPAVITRDPDTGERTTVTPAVMDDDWHVNVRLSGEMERNEKKPDVVEAKRAEISEEKVESAMPARAQAKGQLSEGASEEGSPVEQKVEREPLALSTVTGLEFTKDADLEPQGKAKGWRVQVGESGFAARLQASSIATPSRVWQ